MMKGFEKKDPNKRWSPSNCGDCAKRRERIKAAWGNVLGKPKRKKR